LLYDALVASMQGLPRKMCLQQNLPVVHTGMANVAVQMARPVCSTV